MSEKRKRNSYSPEFKAKVGLEAIYGVKTVNEIGQAYGVHPVQVGQWKKAILDQAGMFFEGKRDPQRAQGYRHTGPSAQSALRRSAAAVQL